MPQRSIDFTPSIRDEVVDRVKHGSRYNVWLSNGNYLTPGHVVGRLENEDGVVVAIGHHSAEVPAFILETVTDSSYVIAYKPNFNENNSEITGFEKVGRVKEIQRDGRDFEPEYPSAECFNEWVEEGNLPV